MTGWHMFEYDIGRRIHIGIKVHFLSKFIKRIAKLSPIILPLIRRKCTRERAPTKSSDGTREELTHVATSLEVD